MDYDIIIIGGGAGAMSSAIYAGRGDLKVGIIEKAMVGGQAAMTHDIANYPGFPDGIDGQELSERMKTQAQKYGAEFIQDEAEEVMQNGEGFFVKLKKQTICCLVVIIATGSDPRMLDVKGEYELRGRGVSYCGTCDGPFFRGRKVSVIGGGDTALKEALHIAKYASELTIFHRRDQFRAEKIYQHQVKKDDNINVVWNKTVKEIVGDKKVERIILTDTVSGEETEHETDGVFIFVGTTPNTHFLCSILPSDCGGHVETDLDMMTNVKGIFAVGDVREHSYRQIATAVGEGATAAIAAEHYISDLKAEKSIG
ncbi:MAG: thioredoxin-disulfide reductase [Planctomycetota bacterium]